MLDFIIDLTNIDGGADQYIILLLHFQVRLSLCYAPDLYPSIQQKMKQVIKVMETMDFNNTRINIK